MNSNATTVIDVMTGAKYASLKTPKPLAVRLTRSANKSAKPHCNGTTNTTNLTVFTMALPNTASENSST